MIPNNDSQACFSFVYFLLNQLEVLTLRQSRLTLAVRTYVLRNSTPALRQAFELTRAE